MCHMRMHYELMLANLILTISNQIAKAPNLIPIQIFRLYGTDFVRMYYILGHHIDVLSMHYNLIAQIVEFILFYCRLLRTRMTLMLRGGTES